MTENQDGKASPKPAAMIAKSYVKPTAVTFNDTGREETWATIKLMITKGLEISTPQSGNIQQIELIVDQIQLRKLVRQLDLVLSEVEKPIPDNPDFE